MSREKYLRLRMAVEGVEYIAGLEFKDGDSFPELKTKLKVRMLNATIGIPAGRYVAVAEAIERTMDAHWPDRKFFIEVGNDNECWIQIWDSRNVFGSTG